MNRSPRKSARFQPPLRGRAATRPIKHQGPERPGIAAYRPPLRPPRSSWPVQQWVSKPQRPTVLEAEPLGGLILLWKWLAVLIFLLSLLAYMGLS